MTEPLPQTAVKVDPETLALRAKSPRAIRFRRGVIVAIAAIGSIALVVVAWLALKPRVFHAVADAPELSQPSDRPPADALSALPATYGDVPKLGPPLPGDLGKPILDRQRNMATATGSTAEAAQQAIAQERERRLTELESARKSPVIVPGKGDEPAAAQTGAMTPGGPTSDAAGSTPVPSPEATASLDPANDPNAQGSKARFVAATDKSGDINPHDLRAPPSPSTITAGSVIAASLITGLRSDLPGLVTAQITENVYDSATGSILLVPQGARLVGSYDSVVAFGQQRALVVWQRIVLPDGSSLRIDNSPATDASGYAGLADKVDAHTWQVLKGVALSTLLGVGPQLALSGDGDLVQAIRMSTQDSAGRAGDQLVRTGLGVQPTITIRPGAQVRLLVSKDLILAPWKP